MTTKKSDSGLRLAGVKVTRTQFNVVYLDLINYLDEIERHTGQRPKVKDLNTTVTLDSGSVYAEGDYTFVYRGHYLGKPVSASEITYSISRVGLVLGSGEGSARDRAECR